MEGLLLGDNAGVEGERCQLLNSYHGTTVFECQMLSSSAFNMNFAVNPQSPRVDFLPVTVSFAVRYFK